MYIRSAALVAVIASSYCRAASSFSLARHTKSKFGFGYSSAFKIVPVIRGGETVQTFLALYMTSTVPDQQQQQQELVQKHPELHTMSPAGENLTKLRALMAKVGADAYIVPSDDPHLSEYVADAYSRRAFISGFRGSAGTAVITHDGAWLWTDSRYFNEAGMQLDANYW